MIPAPTLDSFGKPTEDRFINDLAVSPDGDFDELLDLKNLQGNSTGYIKVFSGDRIEKASSLSINMMPGMRYFNIHIIPSANYLIPRFLFEGMLTQHGSQISMDLFPDIDPIMEVDYLLQDFGDVKATYDEAKQNEALVFESSRQVHMRAFSSPFFLCTFGVGAALLSPLATYGDQYFSAWLKMYQGAHKVSDNVADARRARRTQMAKTLIAEDPDRDRVVAIYGEVTTRSIEAANML